MTLEFGLDSFADIMTDTSGARLSDADTLRKLVDEAVLAESLGIDIFSIGEHYRADMMDSAPAVILSNIAARTERIRLGTSVTVLSTNDPVRTFHDFSTLDALSNGRAQLVVGRASRTDSFPLFGFDLADYEQLFEENLDLWVKLLGQEPVTWSGMSRPDLTEATLHPRLEPGRLPTWVGVGGSPNSVVRAARYGLPLMLAIIGGHPSRFAPYVDLYFRALEQFGFDRMPVGQHSIGLIAESDQEARDAFWPAWSQVMSAETGMPKPSPEQYEHETTHGALFVGTSEHVAQRIVESVRDLSLSRFDLKFDMPTLPWEHRERTIELYGREVIPRVRELLAADAADEASAA
ncbi:MAG: LLM class flavin-dependent oxidoreductase [Pseudolysinimonas sp.]